jgi:hypothetical protein
MSRSASPYRARDPKWPDRPPVRTMFDISQLSLIAAGPRLRRSRGDGARTAAPSVARRRPSGWAAASSSSIGCDSGTPPKLSRGKGSHKRHVDVGRRFDGGRRPRFVVNRSGHVPRGRARPKGVADQRTRHSQARTPTSPGVSATAIVPRTAAPARFAGRACRLCARRGAVLVEGEDTERWKRSSSDLSNCLDRDRRVG